MNIRLIEPLGAAYPFSVHAQPDLWGQTAEDLFSSCCWGLLLEFPSTDWQRLANLDGSILFSPSTFKNLFKWDIIHNTQFVDLKGITEPIVLKLPCLMFFISISFIPHIYCINLFYVRISVNSFTLSFK